MKQNSRFEESYFTGKYSKSVFETLWFSYKSYTFSLIFAVALGLFGRVLLLANANVVGLWVDSLIQGTANNSTDYVKLMAIMTGIGFVSTLIFRIIFSALSAKAVSLFYDETTLRASRFQMSFFDKNPTGRIVTRFSSDYGSVFRLFGGPLAEFLSIVFDLISMVVLVSIASPFYLPAILLIAFLNYVIYSLNKGYLRSSRRELSSSRSPSIAHFSETAQGASTIRSFNRQKSFSERFLRLDQYYLNQKAKVVKNIMFFSFQMNSLTAVLLLITGVVAYFLVQKNLVTIGSIGVAFGFITLSGSTVQMFFEWLAQFEEAMIGVERMNQYLRMPLEAGAKLPVAAQFETGHWKCENSSDKKPPLQEYQALDMEFKNVFFRYEKDLPYVLKAVSFKVNAGERFGIIGRTGSGKSSLIQSLLHLYPIEKGEIRINNKLPQLTKNQAGAVDLELFRNQVSFISQDSILFKGTLKENLTLDSHLSREKIFEALNRVGLEEFASNEGLYKKIEEKGKNLSLGEKQLICMARCLLQEAPIVIMDEATSSVDPKSEEIMVKATHEFFEGRTQIIIAHRLSTLEKCDRILWLHNGEVKELGPSADILKKFAGFSLQQDPVEKKTQI